MNILRDTIFFPNDSISKQLQTSVVTDFCSYTTAENKVRQRVKKDKMFFINMGQLKYFNYKIFQNCFVKRDAILHLAMLV